MYSSSGVKLEHCYLHKREYSKFVKMCGLGKAGSKRYPTMVCYVCM